MPAINPAAVGFVLFPHTLGMTSVLFFKDEALCLMDKLNKPSWTPSMWISACIHNTVYTTVGYGSYLVYRDCGGFSGPAALPFSLYGANILVNVAWYIAFIKKRKFGTALGLNAIIQLTTFSMCYCFYKINPIAGYLTLPYCMMTSVASRFFYDIWRDNRQLPKISAVKED